MSQSEIDIQLAAEAAVLGGIMIHPEQYSSAAMLTADDFSGSANRLIWLAIQSLVKRGAGIDVISVSQALDGSGATMNAALACREVAEYGSVASVAGYAQTVRQYSRT